MRRNLPSLAAIRVFEAAARHGSFTLAAQELGTTQSSVSHHIKILENQIGHALFVRKNRRIELTSVGKELAPALAKLFESMLDAFARLDEKRRTVLSITAPPSITPGWILPKLAEFRLRYPAIEVRFQTEHEIIELERHGYDVGIRSGDGVWPGLTSQKLLPFRLTPLCSPNFIERFGPLKSAEDLLRVPIIEASDPYWTEWFALSGLKNAELTAGLALKLHSRNLYGEAALRGQGIALLSPILYEEELREGRLVQPFSLVADMSPRAYWFVYPVTRRRFATVQAFRKWITKYVTD
jgi:LysR family transcriptional regulator, glycine cleavage system transcriptional activator